MSTKDVYEELAEMEDREDVVGMPKTPEFLKALRLQFTPREARLAVQIGLTGGTLDELSEKTGMEKSKLKRCSTSWLTRAPCGSTPVKKTQLTGWWGWRPRGLWKQAFGVI